MLKEYQACLLLVGAFCLPGLLFAETYLDRLEPVVQLQLDAGPTTGEVVLANGRMLTKAEKFADSVPTRVPGPHAWTGGGWDFSRCEGPYLLKVDEAMSRMGNIEQTDGFSISFWTKGEYSGKTSRIMTGPFDIGTSRDALWGGSHDYQNAHMDRPAKVWDNQWHHIAVVVDFRGSLNNVRIYLDAKRTGVRTGTYLKSLYSAVGRTWAIGARNASDPGFDFGALADMAFFDRPLGDDELAYIHAGPVYAGTDQAVTLPNDGMLKGFAPSGTPVRWNQTAGPESARLEHADREHSRVKFSMEGEYRFDLAAGGRTDEVVVTVESNRSPHVSAGNGIVLDPIEPACVLNGSMSDESVAPGKALSCRWSTVDAPEGGTCRFETIDAPVTGATFSKPGLYTLRLTADDGDLTAISDVSVLVQEGESVSYLRLLNPTLLLDFERPARTSADPFDDALGRSGWSLRRPENGTPVMRRGARPFTGYAWDFSSTDADVEVINTGHLARLWNPKHPARSMSFWMKAGPDTIAHLTSFLGLLAIHPGYGLTYTVQDTKNLNFRPGTALLDEQWHHVAVVMETSDGRIARKLFVDGALADEVDEPQPDPFWHFTSTEIRHPQYVAGRGRTGKDCFAGQLDDFAVFDYALGTNEIAYIVDGPPAGTDKVLSELKDVTVDAGYSAYVKLPDSYSVKLTGEVRASKNLTPVWKKVAGQGEVRFSPPDSASTTATFVPDDTDKDGTYSRFVLRLALVTPEGHEVAGDNVTVVFYPDRAPKRRELTETPAAGVHPRILFTDKDLPELRRKAAEVPVCKRAITAMQGRVSLLRNPNDNHGSLFAALLNGEDVSVEPVYGGNAGGFFLPLMEAAYLAWLDGNDAELTELAQVFSAACRDALTWYRPTHGNALCHDVNWAVGLGYDLLYNHMEDSGRNDARHLLSRMTRHRQTVGTERPPEQNATNWSGYHDHFVMALLAIEGEPDYDVGALDRIEEKKAQFLTSYGIFDSGFPHEGYAYYTFGMTWHALSDLAIGRLPNREMLAVTSRFYGSIEAAFRLLDPDGSGIRSHHDVVGDASSAGLINLPPRQVMVAKYLWPDDRMVDYTYATLLRHLMADEDRRFDFVQAVFGEPVRYPDQSLAEAAGELDPVKFCPDRGAMFVRDRWDTNGLRLDFRCRMDKYWLGHQHSDVNSFELWSHGRPWIVDPGKFSGTINDIGSTILIDGLSSCSSKRNAWPSMPGRFVKFEESADRVLGVGDAKTFFDYSFGKPQSGVQELVKDHGLMWSDFYYARPGETVPKWMTETAVDMDGYGNTKGLWRMNPIKQALRRVVLQKGDRPFVVVADDYIKDDKPHDYLWIANTCVGGEVVKAGGDHTALIMRHKDDVDAGPRLLVKVLNAAGQSGPIDLVATTLHVGKDPIESVRIEIPCKGVVAPEYRVLLFPYEEGEPLPDIQWRADDAVLTLDGVDYDYQT